MPMPPVQTLALTHPRVCAWPEGQQLCMSSSARSWPHSLLVFFACCPSHGFGVCLMIDSSEKTTQGRNDISLFRQWVFFLHLLICSLEICTRVYFLSKRKQDCAHDCLCTLSALHAWIGFLGVQDQFFSLCPVQRHNEESRLWLEISLESSPVFGSPCCSVLLRDPGTIGTIRHAVQFEQQYLVTMEQLRQLLYVLCNGTNGSHS